MVVGSIDLLCAEKEIQLEINEMDKHTERNINQHINPEINEMRNTRNNPEINEIHQKTNIFIVVGQS